MPFVIRALDKVGDVGWVLPEDARGLRTLGTRADADIFSEESEADSVAHRLESVFSILEIDYSVESIIGGATSRDMNIS